MFMKLKRIQWNLGGSGNFRRTREENEDCNMAENDLKIGGGADLGEQLATCSGIRGDLIL
jgi:hypothetical protein